MLRFEDAIRCTSSVSAPSLPTVVSIAIFLDIKNDLSDGALGGNIEPTHD